MCKLLSLLPFWEFFTTALADGFSLEFEWQQVSWTLFNILADFNKAVVWMDSTYPLIFKSSCTCINTLVTVPRAFFQFYFVVSRDSKVHNSASSLFFFFFLFLIIIKSGHLAEVKWPVCISKSQRNLCFSSSRIDSGLFVWSNFYFLHSFQGITLPTLSCLVLCSFCDNLLHPYYVIDRFVSITTQPTLAILLRLIYSCFDKIGSYGVALCWY